MFLRAFKSLILSGLVLLIAAGVGPALAARALCAPEYDADGNLTFDGRQDPPWDAERGDQIGSLLDGGEAGARRASHATTRMASQNRLVEIQTRAGLETVGAVFPSFRQRMDYDDLGRRIRSRTWHKIGGTERIARDDVFVYEGWRLSAILSGHDGSLRQRFAWGLDLSGTVGGAGNVSGLLVFEDSVLGQSHFPRYDGNGNVIGLIAANDPASSSPAGTPGAGGATAAYEYDPFGNALGATGHAAARNPFRFSTTFQDPVTRHSYYGYRFYDPANGRWLSRDPIGEAGGLNLYGFVGNDPVNAVDVLGMSTASVAVPWSFMEAGASQSGGAAWLSRAAPVASGVAIPVAVGAAAVSIEIAGFNAVHEHMALQVCKRNSCFQATQLFVVGMRAISSILSTQALIAEQQNRPEEGSALNQLSVALDIMDRALSFLREHCPDEFAQYQALKEQANVAAQKAEGGRLLSSAQGAASGGAAKSVLSVPGRVQSRINLSNDGMSHVIKRHLSGKPNASQFTMTEAELRTLLSSKQVVQSPVNRTLDSADGIRYVRDIDVGRTIGLDKFSGNQPTSIMTVLTDKFGNLVTATPGVIK